MTLKSGKLLKLMLSMLKIGLFTFGGGYAMISVFEDEFVTKKQWMSRDEYYNMITIAESTPGPIAINCATYLGYKTAGFLGALVATVSVVLPPFTVIYVISLFFDAFLSLEYVGYAFEGIRVAVAYVILRAGIRMCADIKPTRFNIIIFAGVVACMVALSLFAVSFSSVFYILIGGVLGVLTYLVKKAVKPKLLDENNSGEDKDEHIS